MIDNDFSSLGLMPWICRQMNTLGIKRPTPIQQSCIPEILAGRDCIGAAKTGSGKTFAFALPILQKLSEEPTNHFALVLTPTHELAYQISEQFMVAGKPMGCRVCVVAGGTDQMHESQRLKSRPHIIVAMPGRLADHLTGCDTFSFDNLRFLVVDEADRMLNGNFDESLAIIKQCLPKSRQNLFFSATLKEFLKESIILPIEPKVFEWSEESNIATVETLDQKYILCAEYDRDIVLVEALRKYREENSTTLVIVFTNTKKDCQLLSMTLNSVGLSNVCLHGFLKQRERIAALNKFKSKHVRTLIATDVASRGLDIPAVQLIMNHRLPRMANEYIHRVGRTARAGRNGLAISIFRFPKDLEFLSEIEERIGTKLTEHVVDQKMVERIFMQVNVSKREAEMSLDTKDFDERVQNYRRKKWIENGQDPDVMEAQWKNEQQQKKKAERKARLKERKNHKHDLEKTVITDERFKSVEVRQPPKKKSAKLKLIKTAAVSKHLTTRSKKASAKKELPIKIKS